MSRQRTTLTPTELIEWGIGDQATIDRFWGKVEKRDDGHWIWLASANEGGYGFFTIQRKVVLAHRFAYALLVHPLAGTHEIVDHDYRCPKSCVNPPHLRIATHKQNLENRAGVDANNTSGVRGVSWDKHRKKWFAYVWHNGKRHLVGRFIHLHEAEAAAIAKRNELFTHNDRDRA